MDMEHQKGVCVWGWVCVTTPQVASPQDLQQCGSVSNYHSLFLSFFLFSVSLGSPAALFYCSGITVKARQKQNTRTHSHGWAHCVQYARWELFRTSWITMLDSNLLMLFCLKNVKRFEKLLLQLSNGLNKQKKKNSFWSCLNSERPRLQSFPPSCFGAFLWTELKFSKLLV